MKIKKLSSHRYLGILFMLLSLIVTESEAQNLDITSPEEDKSNVEEIIVVFKSHFDIGYTELASETVHNYQTTTIDNALKVAEQSRDLPPGQNFVWTISGWPMKKILEDWDGQTEERKLKVHDAFSSGQFAVHALPFTTHTEMLEPEALVRGLQFSSTLARAANKKLPTAAKMTDVPSHSWILPTILKNAGVNFLHLGCNSGSAFAEIPLLFWWKGPDGSRLLTMYSPDYGTKLFPPKGWKHKTWLALQMRGDNAGPPSPEEVKEILNKIHKEMPGVKVTVGQLSDFSDRIIEEDPQLPIVCSDMPDSWIHGVMSAPKSVIQSQAALPTLSSGESLNTLLNLWDNDQHDITQNVADAYENNLLFYEHTWGGAMYWNTEYLPHKNDIGQCTNWQYGLDKWKENLDSGNFDRWIESWDENSDYADKTYKISNAIINKQMKRLAQSVQVSGPRTVIYNPLPWLVEGIPAMGYKTFTDTDMKSFIKDAAPVVNSEKGILENENFKILIDPSQGSIRSIFDKKKGRELVDVSAEHGFGQFLYERFSEKEVAEYGRAYIQGKHEWGYREWAYVELGKPNMPPASEVPYASFTPVNCNVSSSTNGDTASIIMQYTPQGDNLNFPVSTKIILNGDADYFDLEITVDKPADPWPEAGWICLPFKINQPQFRIGRHGSIIDPSKDINVKGVNRYMYNVGSGVAVYDDDSSGVGVCSLDAPLVSLGMPGDWKFDKTYIPEKPSVYFNLFNNHWSTNFRFWNEGKWTYRIRIWSFDDYENVKSLIVPSMEARYPLIKAKANGLAGSLPTQKEGIMFSRKGVMVTAFAPNPDGEDTVLRLWELGGESGNIEIDLPEDSKFIKATPVNLRGEVTGAPIEITNRKFTVALHAYAPFSVILTN